MARKSGTKRQKSITCSSGEDAIPMDGVDVPNRSKRVRWDVTSDQGEEAVSGPTDSDNSRSVWRCSVKIVEQSDPRVIITSSKSDDACISVLQDYAEAAGSIFQIRPHREFVPSKGRERVLSLKLLTELEGGVCSSLDAFPETSENGLMGAYNFMQGRKQTSGDPNMKRWNATIRLANFASLESAPLCLSCIGALIDFLTRERAAGELDHDGSEALEIQSIEALVLDKVMHINADALHSLQVFESENHASIHSEKTKEGLSLFGVFNTTRTALGRFLLRTWLLRPSLSLEVLEARHTAVECFLLPENTPAIGALQTHLKGTTSVPKTMKALKRGKGTANDWQALVKFTYHSSMLCDALSELHRCGNVEVVKKFTGAVDLRSLKEIGNVINKTIDWEESAEVERICIRPHIDEELDNRKHAYYGIDSVLSKVAQQISQSVPAEYATSLNVVYFPQLGFLITVPMLEEWTSDAGIEFVLRFVRQFSSESHVYFKSQEMHDMDHHIGDLHSSIVDREIELVQELLEKIVPFHDSIMNICDVCAELDCLLAFAEAARSFNYRRPRMVEGSIMDIVQGRHPLQELVADAFVPNDARLVGGVGFGQSYVPDDAFSVADGLPFNSVVLCTGANACGKSVYLKQVALIQYMAQIGSFVPAESATLGIVDKIFTRIQTKESVSKVQSAFMIDLSQVSLALRNCTSRSLILLDEFGKGTISTGNGDLLSTDGLTNPDVVVDGETHSRASVPGERITYLYRVAPGLSYGSHATQCAAMYGLPYRIVARAGYVSELLATYELGKLLEERMSEEELLDLQEAEKVARRFLEWDLTSEEAAHQTGVKARLAQILGREVDQS
ncbi:DNA mismatch repair protein MutS [Pisolithus orientalis]|uniref:DNA mismatch repair protein MutS n=1 Tax=Pisolithus orientalis TaxID=936130 RepID=UPI0022250346|nr:DNA mismatch repair protein MutS [Pisolithus orientalis]KAI6030817.1 DNA mismatch repair protein MutS [Pisolithus orientalis]